MKKLVWIVSAAFVLVLGSCLDRRPAEELWAEDILGNPEYRAISFGGYRHATRDTVPGIEDLKEDMKILHAMDIRILRTYNTNDNEETANLLEAIRELKKADDDFEMYVMLGAWIDCKDAREDHPDHSQEFLEKNTGEIEKAVEMAKEYPGIVKVIAVGNEAMVHWASAYFVHPRVILKWVNFLQDLKEQGELPSKLWITSSDNFAAWGGEEDTYHIEELNQLIRAVDYISMHTYPYHDTHHNPEFWNVPEDQMELERIEKIDLAMERASDYAIAQYESVKAYMQNIGEDKVIHIGETGWSSMANILYHNEGSRASDEYKQKLFHEKIREWTDEQAISCFYFEAFDEKWKDPSSPLGSENHFGLIDIKGQAKYLIWHLVDEGVFQGLTRNGYSITRTFGGNESKMMELVKEPPSENELGQVMIKTINEKRSIGENVQEQNYVLLVDSAQLHGMMDFTYPSTEIKLNPWEGSCGMEIDEGVIRVESNSTNWWGCALEIQAEGKGENLSDFQEGQLHFDILGTTKCVFQLGFQSGIWGRGDQVNSYVMFGPGKDYFLEDDWKSYSIPMKDLNQEVILNDITSLFYLRCDEAYDGKEIQLRNIYYSKK